jgi:xanthine dehydrogenase molybdenum-binding subunit
MNKENRFIGKKVPRKDAADLVRGKAQFIDDLKIPGMLHAKILRSPHAHARIKKIDTTRAKELPGVEAVLTYEDTPVWRAGLPSHIGVLSNTVRYVGDAAALVAAVSDVVAREALELIEVEYEILPAVYDVLEALEEDAPQLYEQFPGNRFPLA